MLDDNMDFVRVFEEKLAEFTDFKHAVAVDCCTNALLLSLEMLCSMGIADKSSCTLSMPRYTYMSVPMTLHNNGWKVALDSRRWAGSYQLDPFPVFDAATDMKRCMASEYSNDNNSLVCISFQQKKRLPLGRGGAILTNNDSFYDMLVKMRYDGRDMNYSDRHQVEAMPQTVIRGYHFYMEPDKAARGILALNQPETSLKTYETHTWAEYADLTPIQHLWM